MINLAKKALPAHDTTGTDNPKIHFCVSLRFHFETSIILGEGLGNEYQGATLSVSLKADSIQAATFNSVEAAYTAWKAAQA